MRCLYNSRHVGINININIVCGFITFSNYINTIMVWNLKPMVLNSYYVSVNININTVRII